MHAVDLIRKQTTVELNLLSWHKKQKYITKRNQIANLNPVVNPEFHNGWIYSDKCCMLYQSFTEKKNVYTSTDMRYRNLIFI